MAKIEQCNGRLIRHYREQLKLTQTQLAARAELSERVIRKAENDESVSQTTLKALASALRTKDQDIHATDLICEPLAIAQAYMRSYLQHGADSSRQSVHLFAPDVVMAIHTDDPNLQFAGEFQGVGGIERMIRYAYAQFNHIKKDFGRWSVNGQRAVAMCEEVLQATGNPDSPLLHTWILHEYTIAGGVISRIDNYIDSAAWSRYLVEVSGVNGTFPSAQALRAHVEREAK